MLAPMSVMFIAGHSLHVMRDNADVRDGTPVLAQLASRKPTISCGRGRNSCGEFYHLQLSSTDDGAPVPPTVGINVATCGYRFDIPKYFAQPNKIIVVADRAVIPACVDDLNQQMRWAGLLWLLGATSMVILASRFEI